ncbi:ABC transporter substrate-binding protein [Actinocorallia longicatena]|uniref:ABC transporter substrate-binding protein n=1 Tax=Actinocorallia longicatena TaxID=111803 RepID=A0ABP6Q945_9ACTN
MRSARVLGASLLIGALTLTACGGAEEGARPAESTPSGPQRIVSLSSTATEMLFAIGAGKQVVAVDEYSTFPAEAPKTKLSGFKPNAEAIIGYKPDLVVLSGDMDGIVAALGKVKIPVRIEAPAAKIEDSYAQLADLGSATGHSVEAAEVAKKMRERIDAAVAAAPKKQGVTYFHELTTDLDTVSAKSFLGQVYALFGLTNIADAADKQGTGYTRLSSEAVVKADPKLIFLGDSVGAAQSPATVAKRPGWAGLTAVRDDGVIALDDDLASRWGPRLPELVETVSAAVKRAG